MYWLYALGAGILGLILTIGIRQIVKELSGKRFAVLGQENVGKTVLIKYLTEGVFTKTYKETILEEKTPKNVLHLKDLKLKIKESKDVSGGGGYGPWKNIFVDSDIVLYLFRLDSFEKGSSIERIKRDVGQISKWINDNQNTKERKIIVIGTFADKVTNIDHKKDEHIAKLISELKRNTVINNMIIQLGGGRKVPLIIGSMVDEPSTMKLVHYLIKAAVQ